MRQRNRAPVGLQSVERADLDLVDQDLTLFRGVRIAELAQGLDPSRQDQPVRDAVQRAEHARDGRRQEQVPNQAGNSTCAYQTSLR
jgi:hypothetical protein